MRHRLVNRPGRAAQTVVHPMSHHRFLTLTALLALALAGCSNPIDQRGNLPTAEQLQQIKPGVTDKPTVTRILGSPSTIAAFDANTWYYISQKTKDIAFLRPELIDQEVLAIDFDKDGVVQDIRHKGLEDRVAVTPNPSATPAPGREFSFWEQLIGNFGRFSGGGSSPTGGSGGGPGH
jgi:outer membrane protein assembly factor BamE (lipoprotein component of BamABCDE complex)